MHIKYREFGLVVHLPFFNLCHGGWVNGPIGVHKVTLCCLAKTLAKKAGSAKSRTTENILKGFGQRLQLAIGSECLMLFLDIVMSVWLNAISGRAKSRTIPFPFLLFITILTFCNVFSHLPSVHYVKSTNPTPSLLQMTGRTVLDCRSLHGM